MRVVKTIGSRILSYGTNKIYSNLSAHLRDLQVVESRSDSVRLAHHVDVSRPAAMSRLVAERGDLQMQRGSSWNFAQFVSSFELKR